MTKKSCKVIRTDGKDKNLLPLTEPMDYKNLMNTLQLFSERYPFIGITYMGTSVLGRGIPMITLGEESKKRRSVLYVGCHHGMEWLTSSLLLQFVNDYCEAYLDSRRVYNVSVQSLYRARCIYVIPCLNVDGADIQINGAGDCIMRDRLISMNGGEDFSQWQANARGVDLNHNYDAGFREYKLLESEHGILGGCRARFSGEAPESEPETASLCSLIRYTSEIGTVMTLHTQGEEIYCGSGDVYVPRCAALASLLSRMTGYSISRTEGMAAYGGLTDWYTKAYRRPAFTVECGKGTNPLPADGLSDIYSRLREAFFSLPLLV